MAEEAKAAAQSRLIIPPLGRLYGALAPLTEPLIRLMAGGSLAFHGGQILFGNVEGAGRFFESIGFDHGLFWAWVVGFLELICGLCLAFGLLTRLVAGPIIVFLVVAIVTYHIDFGYNWEGRGIEFPLFWAIVVLHFLIRGGGPWSLDRLIGREI
jgi:putative oxidoreductase